MEKDDDEQRTRANAEALMKQYAVRLAAATKDRDELALLATSTAVTNRSIEDAKKRLASAEKADKDAKNYRKLLKAAYEDLKEKRALANMPITGEVKSAVKAFDLVRNATKQHMETLRQMIETRASSREVEDPLSKKRKAPEGTPAPKRSRTVAAKKAPEDEDAPTAEFLKQRTQNARNVLADLDDLFARVLDPEEKLRDVLRDLRSVIDNIGSARALLYSPLSVLSGLPSAVTSSQGDATAWIDVVHALQRDTGHKGSAWLKHCLEYHIADATIAGLVAPGLSDEVLNKQVDRSILALVDKVATNGAIAAKREQRDREQSTDEQMDVSLSEEEESADDSEDDPMDTKSSVSSVWDALLSANRNGFEASGKDARAPPLGAGQRRRMLDFYALAVLYGCATHLYNTLSIHGQKPGTRTPDGLFRAADELDVALLTGVLAPVLNSESDEYATLSTRAIVSALNGGDIKKALYVPASLWHLRGATLADMAARFTRIAAPVPKHVAQRYVAKGKKWTERTPQDMASSALPLRHLVFDGSLSNGGVLWPSLLVDALFVWPAITEAQGLRSYTVKETETLGGIVWPLFSLFERRGDTVVTIDHAPMTTIPAPWDGIFTAANKQPTTLLRNLVVLNIVDPTTPPRGMVMTVKRLARVSVTRLLETASVRARQQWTTAPIAWKFDAALAKDTEEKDEGDEKKANAEPTLSVTIKAGTAVPESFVRGFADSVSAVHAANYNDLSREERAKRGHDYALVLDVQIGESLEKVPEEAPKKKGKTPTAPSIAVAPVPQEGEEEEKETGEQAGVTPTLALPLLPPYSKQKFSDARTREDLKKVYDVLWERRASDFVTWNGEWINPAVNDEDESLLTAEEIQTWTAMVLSGLGIAPPAPMTLPVYAEVSKDRLRTASFDPPLGAADAETHQLEWRRYYRYLNFLASVATNTDTLCGYTLKSNVMAIAQGSDMKIGTKFPIVHAPQGAMLWTEWNVHVRISSELEDENASDTTGTRRAFMADDIVPMPWTRDFDSASKRMIFEFNPFGPNAVDGIRATDPYNWFSLLGATYKDLGAGAKAVVSADDLFGLHALAMTFPALAFSDKPMDATLASMQDDDLSVGAEVGKLKSEKTTLENELKADNKRYKLLKARDDRMKSYSNETDELVKEIAKKNARIESINSIIKKASKGNTRFVFIHEDLTVHTHAHAIPILLFNKLFVKSVGAKFELECIQAGRSWILRYSDDMIGQAPRSPVELFHIHWLSDSRGKPQNNRIRVECPVETMLLLYAATVVRVLTAHAVDVYLSSMGKELGATCATHPVMDEAFYDPDDAASLFSILSDHVTAESGKIAGLEEQTREDPSIEKKKKKKKKAKKNDEEGEIPAIHAEQVINALQKKLKMFGYTDPNDRKLPGIYNAVCAPITGALAIARKIEMFTSQGLVANSKLYKNFTKDSQDEQELLVDGKPVTDTKTRTYENYPLAEALYAADDAINAYVNDAAKAVLPDYAYVFAPTIPDAIDASDGNLGDQDEIRETLYTSLNVPWAVSRNFMACTGIAALAVEQLANHVRGAPASLDLAMVMATNGLFQKNVSGKLVDNFGMLDLLDLAADYSPLAYHVMMPSQDLFGITVADAWYAQKMPRSQSQEPAVDATRSALEAYMSVFGSSVVSFFAAFDVDAAFAPVSDAKVRTYASLLNALAAVLLNKEMSLLDTADGVSIDARGNLLVDKLAAIDVPRSRVTDARREWLQKFGKLTDPDNVMPHADRAKGLSDYATFLRGAANTIEERLAALASKIDVDHINDAMAVFEAYVRARSARALKEEKTAERPSKKKNVSVESSEEEQEEEDEEEEDEEVMDEEIDDAEAQEIAREEAELIEAGYSVPQLLAGVVAELVKVKTPADLPAFVAFLVAPLGDTLDKRIEALTLKSYVKLIAGKPKAPADPASGAAQRRVEATKITPESDSETDDKPLLDDKELYDSDDE